MKIERVKFRNFGSYGNRMLELDVPIEPSFFLIQGKNGHGKCLLPETEIKTFSNKEDFEKFQAFLKLYRSKE
jgi:recombinational DNA repair ATPase RecF